nr:phospholipid scramblase 2-like [Dermacentor andersoni]
MAGTMAGNTTSCPGIANSIRGIADRAAVVFAPTAGMVRQQATAMPMAETPVADAQRGTYVPMWTPSLAPPALPAIRGCPAGLEYLTKIDHLLVHQVLQPMEVIFGVDLPNKYIVKNTMGQFVFKATERCVSSASRFGSQRPFTMGLFDYRNDKVLLLDRPLRCDCRLCCCCLQARTYSSMYGKT